MDGDAVEGNGIGGEMQAEAKCGTLFRFIVLGPYFTTK